LTGLLGDEECKVVAPLPFPVPVPVVPLLPPAVVTFLEGVLKEEGGREGGREWGREVLLPFGIVERLVLSLNRDDVSSISSSVSILSLSDLFHVDWL